MIKIVHGDLLEATEDILGHQVNCQGVMGSGIAVQIKKKYPEAFKAYKKSVDKTRYRKQKKETMLGFVQLIQTEDKIIANLFGQLTFGARDGTQHTSTDALKECFQKLRSTAEELGLSVALPYKIGSDRGGADWIEVLGLIEEAFEGYEITLYKYDKG